MELYFKTYEKNIFPEKFFRFIRLQLFKIDVNSELD